MTRVAAAMRRPGLLAALLVSVSLAGLGLWAWLGPDTVDSISTAGLLALLGLLIFPWVTLGTMVYERKTRGNPDRSPTAPTRSPEIVVPPAAPGPEFVRAFPIARADSEQQPVLPRDIAPPGGRRPERAKTPAPRAGSSTA